jgi:hypothetical protein
MPKEDIKLSRCHAIRSVNTGGSVTDFPFDGRATSEIWEMTASTGSIAMHSSAVTSYEAVDPGIIAWLCYWKG